MTRELVPATANNGKPVAASWEAAVAAAHRFQSLVREPGVTEVQSPEAGQRFDEIQVGVADGIVLKPQEAEARHPAESLEMDFPPATIW